MIDDLWLYLLGIVIFIGSISLGLVFLLRGSPLWLVLLLTLCGMELGAALILHSRGLR